MSKLKQFSGRDVTAALKQFGFDVVATRGSHAKLRRVVKEEGRETRQTLTVPLHNHLAPGTARAIFRQASKYIVEDELKPFFFSE